MTTQTRVDRLGDLDGDLPRLEHGRLGRCVSPHRAPGWNQMTDEEAVGRGGERIAEIAGDLHLSSAQLVIRG